MATGGINAVGDLLASPLRTNFGVIGMANNLWGTLDGLEFIVPIQPGRPTKHLIAAARLASPPYRIELPLQGLIDGLSSEVVLGKLHRYGVEASMADEVIAMPHEQLELPDGLGSYVAGDNLLLARVVTRAQEGVMVEEVVAVVIAEQEISGFGRIGGQHSIDIVIDEAADFPASLIIVGLEGVEPIAQEH